MNIRMHSSLLWNVLIFTCGTFAALATSVQAEQAKPPKLIELSGFTAYIEHDRRGARINARRGITDWTSPRSEIQFFVNIKKSGPLDVGLLVSIPKGENAKIRLTIAGKEFVTSVTGQGDPDKFSKFDVGKVNLNKTGYYRISLQGVSKSGRSFGDVRAVVLTGEAIDGAHFNTKPRRNSASVHLFYPTPKKTIAEWFYNEITVPKGFDPIHTYYMACGFARGYFGIQVNSATERRVIFSIWDSGNEGVDRKKVKQENRVTLLKKGAGVVAHGFGNEGTGGHSHWVYPWKTEQPYRFLVHAQPNKKQTTYTAYFFLPDRKKWKLIARFRAPKDGRYLRGLYSFVENFGGATGHMQRKAHFNNQWINTDKGKWVPLLEARFSHDPTGRKDRKDYGGGVDNGRFYLFNGGFIPQTAKYGDRFTRPASTDSPDVLVPLTTEDLVE